jgi:pimeloyl-ACP methyl ester carboxylesterase
MLLRYLLCLAGIFLAVLVFTLSVLAFDTPISSSGGYYLLGSSLLAVGLILAPWRPKAQLALMLSGLAIVLVVAGARINQIQNETARLKVILLPSGKETRLINALIDERDTLLFGERLLRLIGGVSAREHKGLTPAVTAAYQKARMMYGDFPSPVLSTYLGLQRSSAFDAVVIEPSLAQSAPVGVIFLHGFTGNVSIQCWQIARAVEMIGAVTVCPSTGWQGYWWTPEGEANVRTTFDYLRERGVERIYLGGFSNGGNGVGSLMPTLASEQDMVGLFFVDGLRNAAGVRETGLPVLVIQGVNDERIPVEAARQFVVDVGERGTYIELKADHFLIMKHPQQVQEAISAWLDGQQADD